MTESNPTAIEVTAVKRSTRVMEYFELTKPRLTMLSVFTTLGGFYMASQGPLDLSLLVHTIIGTFMSGAGCGALNMYVEREHDAQMRRTMARPLPSGRLVPAEALLFGLFLAIGGVIYLALAVNMLTAILAATTVISYVLMYTPLKRISTLNTVVGAIPGAIPPVMGWAAVRGSIGTEAWVLFALLFFWQMPHFLALAWMYRNDYERAGYKILSVLDRDGGSTSRQILLYTSALLPVSLLGTAIGMTGPYYFYCALVLGLGFLGFGIRLAITRKNKHAKHLFYYSLLYLPIVMLAMALDRIA